MLYNLTMAFPDWLRACYEDWNEKQGGFMKLADFARYLGIPPTSLSNWMNGGYKPRGDNLAVLARKLGPETYDALGLPRPPEADERAHLLSMGLPAGFVDDLLRVRDEYTRELVSKGSVGTQVHSQDG